MLKTESKTAALSRWLSKLLTEMIAAAHPSSSEAGWAFKENVNIGAALTTYADHRKASDTARTSSHQALYRTFNEVLGRIVPSLNARWDVAIKLPCCEQDIADRFKAIISNERWLFFCRGCGGMERGTGTFWMEGKNCYCKACLDQYTMKCHGCESRTDRNNIKSQETLRDTEACRDYFFCNKCCSKKLDTKKCDACGCKYINGPAGNPNDEITPKELEVYGKFCYVCASTYSRGECGHISARLYEVPCIPNVEDDDRDREDITGRGNSRVCANCRDKYSTGDDDIQHWNVKNPKCSSKSYDEVGSKRSFGVEIEVCQPKNMRPMSEDIKAFWTSKRDASLPEIGVELASTILYGDTGLKVVKDLCDYAGNNDWRVDTRAGLHLHVGLPEEDIQRVAAVAMGYHLTYDLWSSFVAPSRQRCKYCRRNSYSPDNLLQRSAKDLIHALLNDPSIEGRRCWVNWHSYGLHNTVELRLHHGTLKYDKISNWVKAHTRFVDWCVEQGSPAKVYELLGKKNTRGQFLLVTQDAWKDRPLGRWYRKRASDLFDGCAPLPDSNRRLRKRGIEPSKYRPGFDFSIGDKSAYICKMQERFYVISDHPTGGGRASFITQSGWGNVKVPPVRFHTRLDGMNFIKEAAKTSLETALAGVGKKPARRPGGVVPVREVQNPMWVGEDRRIPPVPRDPGRAFTEAMQRIVARPRRQAPAR